MNSPARKSPTFLRTALFRIPAIILAAPLALCSLPALAGYLDDVEVDSSGKNVVIRIRFNISVQYLRNVPEKEGDLVQIFLRQQSGEVAPPVAEETKSVP